MVAHNILKPSFVRTDFRGDFREILNMGTWQSLVHGAMKKGAELGNHYHRETRIFFFMLSGRVKVITEHAQTGERDEFYLHEFEGCYFEPYESHKIIFETDGSFVFMKDKQYNPNNNDTYPHPIE